MKELQLVNFEQAQRLKKAGFDWETHKGYDLDGHKINLWVQEFGLIIEHYKAPEKALVLKWIRDVKGVMCGVQVYGNADYWFYIGNSIINNELFPSKKQGSKTYEAAESALLDELLTILEKGE